MGRPQATQLSKRIAKTLATQVADTVEELAAALETSTATILRFRATGLITFQNLKKLACFQFFPLNSLEGIKLSENVLHGEPPLSVKLFGQAEALTYSVTLLHKEFGEIHINVLWKKDFEAVKENSVLIKSLLDVGYHYLIVIDSDEMPKLVELKELEEKLPKEINTCLKGTSTESLMKELCERGYKVTLEIK